MNKWFVFVNRDSWWVEEAGEGSFNASVAFAGPFDTKDAAELWATLNA